MFVFNVIQWLLRQGTGIFCCKDPKTKLILFWKVTPGNAAHSYPIYALLKK